MRQVVWEFSLLFVISEKLYCIIISTILKRVLDEDMIGFLNHFCGCLYLVELDMLSKFKVLVSGTYCILA
jgi:hypothetical protein